MSRCYPFPPPGYIKNAPAELELPSKKEKRKHKDKDKDKKKKKKKHSATNGDLILQEDKSIEEIQQSRLATEGFGVGSERLPETKSVLSAAANQGAIQRLQNDTLRDKASSNCVLATNVERLEQKLQLHKLKNEGLSNGVLAGNCERLQESVLSNGGLATDNKRSKQSMQTVNSETEVLTNGMLVTQSKRLKADNPREKMLSNGSAAATSCKRPEQGPQTGNLVNEVFSNGVLSTKRKRLQADNHGDKLLPSAVLPNDCKRSQQGSQAGSSKYEASSDGVQATSNMRLQADRSRLSNAITSERSEQTLRADNSSIKAIRDGSIQAIRDGTSIQVGSVDRSSLSNTESSEQRLCADNSSIKAIRDGVQPTSIQAGNANGKELLQHSRATNSRLRTDKLKNEVILNGVVTMECQKLQADSFRVKMPSNGVLATRCGRSEQNLQAGNKVASNGVRDTNIRSLQATYPSEKVFSGAVLATNCKRSEQGDTFTKEVLPNGTMTAKRLQSGSAKPEAISHGARATISEAFEQRLQAGNSRHEAQANGVLDAGRLLQADKSRTKTLSHGVVATTSYERCDPRLQEDQLKNDVMSNGELASKCEEFNADSKVKNLPSLVARATVGGDAEAAKDVTPATPASRVNVERDDELIKLCRHLARPLAEQVCAVADDEEEEWLKSSDKELQPKPGEKWDSQIPQALNTTSACAGLIGFGEKPLGKVEPRCDTNLGKRRYFSMQKMEFCKKGSNECNSPAADALE